MQHKLKSILRSRKQSLSAYSEDGTIQDHEANSPHAEQHSRLSDDQSQGFSDTAKRDSYQSGRSQPLSSIYNDRHVSDAAASQSTAVDRNHANPSAPADESIAKNYRSYLPVLSPVDDSNGNQHMTMGGDRRLTAGHSTGRREEGVADRNINRYATSPEAGGGNSLQKGDLTDNTLLHKEDAAQQSNHWKKTGYPTRTRHNDESSRTVLDKSVAHHDTATKSSHQSEKARTATRDDLHNVGSSNGTTSSQDWKLKQKSLLDGVVDLRDTVDTHKDTSWAPTVTHEVIKRHEHEIVQKKIYREIHNYSYHHRLQPVIHTEVLAPRHFIPNPHGDGLIEISAEELPARTGKNRWWDIVQKGMPEPYALENPHQWRTEPEIIKGKPYITDEGFERRETTIRYPPTLADMSSYSGAVQPVHFDHKTGQRWLGEVTTMGKITEQVQHMKLREDIHDLSPSATITRKPVSEAFM